MIRKLLQMSLALLMAVFISQAYAKMIDLYEQPDLNAKKLGHIDSEKGFVPIFSQKSGDWIKVGDPSNGNTGWIKSSDIADAMTSEGFMFSQSMTTKDGKTVPSWVVKFGTPKTMTTEESNAFWKQISAQQEAIQKDMQRMINDMFHSEITWPSYPVIMPIVMVPVQPTEKTTPQKK